MNETILIGRISTDLELKEVNSNKLVNFNVAVNRQDNKTDFIPCVCFNQIAENLCKYQKKGNLIAVKGSIRQNEYLDKEGNKRYSFNVLASRVQFLEASNKENTSDIEKITTKIEDDDVPF